MLVITGCIITTDAMGCQVEVAQTCVDQQADYVLALKENQENLYQDVKRAVYGPRKLANSRPTPMIMPTVLTTPMDGPRNASAGPSRIPRSSSSYAAPSAGRTWDASCRYGVTYQDGNEQKREDRFFIASLRGQARQLLGRFARIGASKTTCIGCSISPFARMIVGSARIKAPRTSPCCVTLRSTCSKPRKPPSARSRASAFRQLGRPIIREKVLAGFAQPH